MGRGGDRSGRALAQRRSVPTREPSRDTGRPRRHGPHVLQTFTPGTFATGVAAHAVIAEPRTLSRGPPGPGTASRNPESRPIRPSHAANVRTTDVWRIRRRLHGAFLAADRGFNAFRSLYRGKSSPSHLFWGSFDLAVTRFSGRSAPVHPGGVPHLPDTVTREAYSHEVISAGFWPGGGGVDEAAFYAYAYPSAAGLADRPVEPAGAFWHAALGEFVLSYDEVRRAADPDAELQRFLDTTFEAAADLLGWPEGLVIGERPAFARPPA